MRLHAWNSETARLWQSSRFPKISAPGRSLSFISINVHFPFYFRNAHFCFWAWCRWKSAVFPFIWCVFLYIFFFFQVLWNVKTTCIFRRNVHFVHEKYNECYKMGWLGKIIWKYRDMELSLHQFKKRILTGWYDKS